MTVLVAIDGESTPDRSLEVGAELAERFDEELVALHVMPQDRFENIRDSAGTESDRPIGLAVYPGFADVEGAQPEEPNPYNLEVAESDARKVARAVASDTLGEGANVALQGRVGEPVEEIVAEADRREARYIVIGGRKRTPVGKAVFGSVTQSVLLNAERPVITVPKEAFDWTADRATPVVAAVDRSDRAPRVVTEAWQLAEATGRPLHVAHVMTEDSYEALDRPEGEGGGSKEGELRAAAEDIADEAAEDIADEYTAVGLVGKPSKRLVEYAGEEEAGYLVAAGRSRSPVGKVLFGSVTQSLLLAAERPVLTVLSE